MSTDDTLCPIITRTNKLAKAWHGDTTLDSFYSGEIDGGKKFPDAFQRQHQLIELTVDTGIETVVAYFLRQIFDTDSQLPLLTDQALKGHKLVCFSEEDQQYIYQKFAEARAERKEPDYIELIAYFRDSGKILKSKELGFESELEEYDKKAATYRASANIANKVLSIARNTNINVDLISSKVPKPEKPFDPRAIAFSLRYGNILKIEESGEKDKGSALEKLLKRKKHHITNSNVLVDELDDVNRVDIIPQSPRVAADFFALLANRKKPVEIDGKILPRVVVEDWKIRKTGYIDQKAAVVLDEGFDTEHGQIKGAIAEIKVDAPKLFEAYKFTHLMYEIMREMENSDHSFTPAELKKRSAGNDSDLPEEQHTSQFLGPLEIHALYECLQAIYNDPDVKRLYKFEGLPDVSSERIDNNKTLRTLYHNVLKAHQQIYAGRVNESSPEWQRLYLEKMFAKDAELCKGYKRRNAHFLPAVQAEIAPTFLGRSELRAAAFGKVANTLRPGV